jgi:phosphatidate phosphatase APP1
VRDIEERAAQQTALLNSKAWELEEQIQAEREEQASLEARVESLSEEQMRSFYIQEELRNQVGGLKRVLTLSQMQRRGNAAYYGRWVCTRSDCRRVFYAPRDQRQIWCFYCGKRFNT